jgi:hypothetical protein
MAHLDHGLCSSDMLREAIQIVNIVRGHVVVVGGAHGHRVRGQAAPEVPDGVRREVVLVAAVHRRALQAAAGEGVRVAEVGARLRVRVRAHLVRPTHVAEVRYLGFDVSNIDSDPSIYQHVRNVVCFTSFMSIHIPSL